jgi:hypothetical protein
LDLITAVPLEEMDYRHVGEILHLESGDTATLGRRAQHSLVASLQHNIAAFPANAHRFISELIAGKALDLSGWVLPDDALAHHAPWNYARKLRVLASRNRSVAAT